MAETGFEMLVFSFGSGFKLESADPLCLLGATSLSASSEAILEQDPFDWFYLYIIQYCAHSHDSVHRLIGVDT